MAGRCQASAYARLQLVTEACRQKEAFGQASRLCAHSPSERGFVSACAHAFRSPRINGVCSYSEGGSSKTCQPNEESKKIGFCLHICIVLFTKKSPQIAGNLCYSKSHHLKNYHTYQSKTAVEAHEQKKAQAISRMMNKKKIGFYLHRVLW